MDINKKTKFRRKRQLYRVAESVLKQLTINHLFKKIPTLVRGT